MRFMSDFVDDKFGLVEKRVEVFYFFLEVGNFFKFLLFILLFFSFMLFFHPPELFLQLFMPGVKIVDLENHGGNANRETDDGKVFF